MLAMFKQKPISFFHKQPEDQAQHNADNDRGGDGKIEFKVVLLHGNVTGQAAEAGFL